jgi:hypothetical protein
MSSYPDEGLKRKLALPFATPTAKRLKDFTKNMERAAILYIAESNRKKGESYVLRKADEKLVFISEACYPIWLIPYGGATLLFDGLGLTSHSLSYDVIPDIEVFNKSIRENRETTEAYAAAIARNKDYFGNFCGVEEIRIEGLITSSDLMEDFKAYLLEAEKTKRQFTTKVILTAAIKECEVRAGIAELSNLRRRTDKDIKKIDSSMKLLNTTTERRIKVIRREIRKSQEKYRKKIEKIKPKVKRKILRIHRKYNLKVARKVETFKRRLQRLHENQIRLQETLRHLKTEAKRCETRMQLSRKGERIQWTLKLKRIKKKIPSLNKEIKTNVKKMQSVEAALKFEVAQQKTECYERVETAKEIFVELQAAKEAEVAMKRREGATLIDLTSDITKLMQEIIQRKRVFLKEFDKLTMSMRRRGRRLVYIPFYIARYEKGDKKRYMVYPPSTVGDMGILTRMKGALGAAKVKALLQFRSKAMTTFLNQLAPLIEKDPMLEKDITEAGIQASMVIKKRLRVDVKKGLKELEKENWITKNELETFSKLLYVYTDAAPQ